MKIAKIKSAGTEGVQLAALDCAKKYGIPISGMMAKNAKCKYSEIKEGPSCNVGQSLLWNARDSHATLIITPYLEFSTSEYCYNIAEALGRPVLVTIHYKEIIRWLNEQENEEITLNIMGPSREEYAEAESLTTSVLENVFDYFINQVSFDYD